MSLNGLDSPAIIEAYEAAAAEPGGWFLLKYVSRDEVDLLGRGSNGVVEIRGVIAQYTEASPLYGFIRYRRRSILIKYVPEGTSRLVQARVTVHFQAISEKFSPYDTVFPITLPKELNDTSLSSACSLHTATGSTSSSNSSLRRRKLMEIAEDAEDPEDPPQVPPKDTTKPVSFSSEERPRTAAGPGPVIKETDIASTGPINGGDQRSSDRADSRSLSESPPKRQNVGSPLSNSRERGLPTAMDAARGTISRLTEERRTSTNSARPTPRDLYNSYSYTSRAPKVKLGPRPSIDAHGRPHTSGSVSRQQEPHPVSTLPAGIRIPRKVPTSRPQSSNHNTNIVPAPSVNPVVGTLSPVETPIRPTTSPGPVTTPSPPPKLSSPSLKSSTMTPEKQKLMKALQLRKRQLSAQQEQVTKITDHKQGESGSPHTNLQESIHTTKEEIAIEESPTEQPQPQLSINLVDKPTTPAEIIESASTESTASHWFVDELSQSTTKSSLVSKEIMLPETQTEEDLGEQGNNATSKEESDHRQTSADCGGDSHCSTDEGNLIAIAPEDVPLPPIADDETDGYSGRDVTLEQGMDNETAAPQTRTSSESSNNSVTDHDSTDEDIIQDPIELSQKRLEFAKSVPSDQDVDHSEEQFLSDESFMDELKTATFQEAKPVLVTKSPVTRSPITPVFPAITPVLRKKARGDRPSMSSRTVSNPAKADNDSHGLLSPSEVPVIETARSVSASFLNNVRSRQASTLLAKKVNVSSGISQRIKALEMRSGKAATPDGSPVSSTSSPVSPTTAVRKPSLKSPPSPLNTSFKPTALAAPFPHSQSPSPNPSPRPLTLQTHILPSPRRESVTNLSDHSPKKQRPESISVIARIVRDDNSSMSSENRGTTPFELHQSPLIIEHQRSSAVERPSSIPPSSPSSRPNSSSPTFSRPPSISSKQSTSSRGRSDSMSSQQRRGSSASLNAIKEDKKESKKNRLLRRMSSISSSSRKSLAHAISPTLKEEPAFEPVPVPEVSKPENILEGWVNVQLPDTLLWRRRCLQLDSHGYIFLSQSQVNENSQPTRRYHLSDFKAIVIPDRDIEELPYSVILELGDGGTLQCACQNGAEQTQILKKLKDCYQTLVSHGHG